MPEDPEPPHEEQQLQQPQHQGPEPDGNDNDIEHDASENLLGLSSSAQSHRPKPTDTKAALARLYVSHFLSTWSSRMFEFGAVLFLASIFSGTLLYASVYALVRSLAVAVLSSWLGARVDRLNRLTALRQSIGMATFLPNLPQIG